MIRKAPTSPALTHSLTPLDLDMRHLLLLLSIAVMACSSPPNVDLQDADVMVSADSGYCIDEGISEAGSCGEVGKCGYHGFRTHTCLAHHKWGMWSECVPWTGDCK